MPSFQQWVFTDLVSGETATNPNPNLPPHWGTVGDDCHGPRGLYVIAQRLITRVIPGLATYAEVMTTPYDSTSALDGGFTIPEGL